MLHRPPESAVEAESNILLAPRFSVYLNATKGSARYENTGLSVQQAPRDTETIGINYVSGSWGVGFFNKRIGKMFNDNGSTNEAVVIDPFNITNLFANYTIGGSSMFAKTKVRLAVNNLFDDHSILGVNPAATKTSVAAPGDVLNTMAARSVSLSFTVGFAPAKRP